MTTGTVLAKNFMVFIGNVALGCQTDVSFTISRTIELAACKQGKKKLIGDKDITGSASGLFAYDHTYGADELIAAVNDDDQVPGTVRFATEESGDKYYEFDVYITEVTVEAGVEGMTTYSCNFESVDGELTTGTVS